MDGLRRPDERCNPVAYVAQQAAPSVEVFELLRSSFDVLQGRTDVGDQPLEYIDPAVQRRQVQRATAASSSGRLVIASSLPVGCAALQYQLHQL